LFSFIDFVVGTWQEDMNIHSLLYSSSTVIYRRAKRNLIISFSVLCVDVRCSYFSFQAFKKNV
jgi:hypothetical protein